ncbi:MAG: LuxR C-terminal-related transcriptional regulator [Ramlibacter sp.]
MHHLTRNDHATALAVLARLEPATASTSRFAREAVDAVAAFVASELTTLSVCDLVTGHRSVVGGPEASLSGGDIDAFDRHFFEHPLVRHHGVDGGTSSWRIADAMPRRRFLDSAIYAEYYRRVGLDQAVAVPLWMDGRTLVSLVLNRRGVPFSDRDRDRLELLRPHLAFLYRLACRAPAAKEANEPAALRPRQQGRWPDSLTPRECQVVHWLAHGKTDADIAAQLGTSTRTVHKHLEHVYVKLGVETRTAAVMRALDLRPPDGTPLRRVAERTGAARRGPDS